MTTCCLLDKERGGFDPAHFRSLVSVEDQHFWFRTRNQVISTFAEQLISSLKPGYRVLEMGCGDGNVLRFLEAVCGEGCVVGMDLYGEGLQYARRRTACSLVQGDVSQSPFGKDFHLIGMFDVLEHIPNDVGILDDVWKLLEPNGVLLLTVPAHGHLWSYFDEVSGHCRRYETDELRLKLEQAGFAVEFLTEYMASVYPLMWLTRKIKSKVNRGSAKSQDALTEEVKIVPLINGILSLLLSLESKRLARRKSLPFGASLVAIARRAGSKEFQRARGGDNS
jgi:2-polyprenyl-3-methyl-5-hydroxy-6-metoxy-1,4-benzoquinol methylase